MRTSRLALSLIALATLATLSALPHPCSAMTVPSSIEGQSLTDSSHFNANLTNGNKLTVVVFLSAHCPCSMSHEPALANLAKEFGSVAQFVGVHSNSDETFQESADHFKKSALPFPVIQDPAAQIANTFGAVKTPHVFVLGKNGEVLFQGGVDDSHDAAKASKPYLKTALESLRAGRTPEITLARSLGCQIRR